MTDSSERYRKTFPISWDQLHRDCKTLAWRLHEKGKWKRILAIARGGLVPAAIIARELDIHFVDTICVSSYTLRTQGEPEILKQAIPFEVALRGASSSTTSSTRAVRPKSSGKCSRRPISPRCTRNPTEGPSSIPSSRRSPRTPGSCSPGTPSSPSPSRSSGGPSPFPPCGRAVPGPQAPREGSPFLS